MNNLTESMVEPLVSALMGKYGISRYEAIERLKGRRPFFGTPKVRPYKGDPGKRSGLVRTELRKVKVSV